MNVFLLGNGFDLYHNLPTTYSCFLHTVEFLKDKNTDDFNTVGDVLKNINNNQIKRSCEQYQSAYDEVPLDITKIKFLAEKAKNNQWFSYLLKSLNKNIGWIDFEKEIMRVINVIDDFISEISRPNSDLKIHMKLSYVSHIISAFSFFLEKQSGLFYQEIVGPGTVLKKKYILETPLGSKNFVVNKTEIANDLYGSLAELAEMLKTYLDCFVENTIETLIQKELLIKSDLFNDSDIAISFNYTKTFEKVYLGNDVSHIHGSIDDKIVLGVNPDKYDEIGNIDCTFSIFKKYFQRLIYRTDLSYRKTVSNIKKFKGNYYILRVLGHSLDETDEDIIKELFKLSDKIVIYYHDLNSYSNLVKNLISIYGKSCFDTLRIEKELEFLELK